MGGAGPQGLSPLSAVCLRPKVADMGQAEIKFRGTLNVSFCQGYPFLGFKTLARGAAGQQPHLSAQPWF